MDKNGRPVSVFMPAGPVSDDTGGAALRDNFPVASWTLADRGYDADWFQDALEKTLHSCPEIPQVNPSYTTRKNLNELNRSEIMFGRLEDVEAYLNPLRHLLNRLVLVMSSDSRASSLLEGKMNFVF